MSSRAASRAAPPLPGTAAALPQGCGPGRRKSPAHHQQPCGISGIGGIGGSVSADSDASVCCTLYEQLQHLKSCGPGRHGSLLHLQPCGSSSSRTSDMDDQHVLNYCSTASECDQGGATLTSTPPTTLHTCACMTQHSHKTARARCACWLAQGLHSQQAACKRATNISACSPPRSHLYVSRVCSSCTSMALLFSSSTPDVRPSALRHNMRAA